MEIGKYEFLALVVHQIFSLLTEKGWTKAEIAATIAKYGFDPDRIDRAFAPIEFINAVEIAYELVFFHLNQENA